MNPDRRASSSDSHMMAMHSGQIRDAEMKAEGYTCAGMKNVSKNHSNAKHGTVSQDPVLILKKSGELPWQPSATKEDMNVKES